ncbi:MAG: nucleotidyltransferase family protein [Candidatus Woesearchaeota archaeon]|jgi:glucose-1-phosphate thymidylyltransferase
MKAIILAAGYPTRLYPLTLNTPKPLLFVKEKLLINYTIDKLNACKDITEIFVVTNDKFYSHFVTWQKTVQSQKKITIVNDGTKENGARLGAVGDMYYVIEQQKITEDILVVAGDNLFSFELSEIVSYFNAKKTIIVGVYDTQDKKRIANILGCLELDVYNKIIGFEEKPEHPKTTLASTGCYVFPKSSFAIIKDALKIQHPDRHGDLLVYLMQKLPLYAFTFKGFWYDIGCPAEYELVQNSEIKF